MAWDIDMAYIVYILRCADNSYYTGYTKGVLKRLRLHRRGMGSKYVKSRLPFRLVHMEQYATQGEAMRRENAIKKMKKPEKNALVNR